MEQHPIPQQISSYQFRLVGDMTLKQFFQLAGGLLISLIFYSTPIIGIVKWPIVIISALLGAAMAFVPLEERPLERWIFAFFRAIYSPTEFFWQKTVTPAKFYQDEPQVAEAAAGPQAEALKQYFSSANQKTGSAAKLEGAEAGFFSRLTGIVSGLVVQATGGPISPTSTQTVSSTQLNKQVSESTNKPADQAVVHVEAKQIQIPQIVPIKIEKNVPQHLVVEEKTQTPGITTNQVAPILAGNEIVSTKQAIFSIDAAPPNPPSTPNVVVGQVVDETRRILEGAIMEIRDSAGRAIRAIRSNRAGHFVTVTPVDNGRYDIITDKEGYEFFPVSFEANGQIIPPILVQGRKLAQDISVPMINNTPINNSPTSNMPVIPIMAAQQ